MRLNFKRAASAAVTAAMVLTSATAFGAEIKSQKYENGKFTVSGTTEDKGLPVKIEVFKNLKTELDAQNANSSELLGIFEYVDQKESDKNGDFEFEVPVDTSSGKNHMVRLSFFGGKTLKTEFAVYTDEEAESAVEAFLSDETKTAEKLKTLINDYYIGLKINSNDLTSVSDLNLSAVTEAVVGELSGGETVQELSDLINKYLAVEVLKISPSLEVLKRYETVASYKDANWFEDYKNLSDASKELVAQAAKGAADEADLLKKMGGTAVLETLKLQIWSGLEAKLLQYNDLVGASLDPINALSAENRKAVYERLLTALTSGGVSQLSQIDGLIKSYAADYPAESESSSKPYTGGTGGGGGGGGGGVAVTNKTNNNLQTENSGIVVEVPFSDLADFEWAKDSVEKLYKKGVVKGKSENLFDPSANVSREEFTAMIVRALGLKSSGAAFEFDDVSKDRWSREAVAAAFENNIINGVSETSFAPEESISRQDMAAIAYRICSANGLGEEKFEQEAFSDGADIAEYAQTAAASLLKAGIMLGADGSFRPSANATRAEAAVIIDRVITFCSI